MAFWAICRLFSASVAIFPISSVSPSQSTADRSSEIVSRFFPTDSQSTSFSWAAVESSCTAISSAFVTRSPAWRRKLLNSTSATIRSAVITANSTPVSRDQNSCFFINRTVSSIRIASLFQLYPRYPPFSIVFPLRYSYNCCIIAKSGDVSAALHAGPECRIHDRHSAQAEGRRS